MVEEHSERLSTSIDPELKQRVRMEAAKEGMTMSAYVRKVLEEQIGEEGNPKPTPTTAMA